MNNAALFWALAETFTMSHEGREDPPRARPQRRPCGLPGCDVITEHNGGYCCAEHCREHRITRANERD